MARVLSLTESSTSLALWLNKLYLYFQHGILHLHPMFIIKSYFWEVIIKSNWPKYDHKQQEYSNESNLGKIYCSLNSNEGWYFTCPYKLTFLALAKASTESTSSTSLPAHMLLTRDLALDTLLDTLDTVALSPSVSSGEFMGCTLVTPDYGY